MNEISMFSPSLASFVNYHRDGIHPEDLASFSCLNVGTSLPATESVSTVFTTAGSLSLSPVPSLKLARSDWTK
ncbi:MAG: hypothetical protein ACTSSE_14505 [Candidatus Thorarchaeota archaeon]